MKALLIDRQNFSKFIEVRYREPYVEIPVYEILPLAHLMSRDTSPTTTCKKRLFKLTMEDHGLLVYREESK